MHSKTKRLGFWLSLISVGGDIQPRLVTVLTPATYRHCVAFQPKLRFVNARKLGTLPPYIPRIHVHTPSRIRSPNRYLYRGIIPSSTVIIEFRREGNAETPHEIN